MPNKNALKPNEKESSVTNSQPTQSCWIRNASTFGMVTVLSAGLLLACGQTSNAEINKKNTNEKNNASLSTEETPENSGIKNSREMLPSDMLKQMQDLPQLTTGLGSNGAAVIDPTKPTLVKFWASWCPMCLGTLEETQKWRTDPKFAGLNVVTVASPTHLNEKNEDEFRSWYAGIQADYPKLPVLVDTSGELISKLGVQVYPSWAILDKTGNLVHLIKGNMSEQQAYALAENADNDFVELKAGKAKPAASQALDNNSKIETIKQKDGVYYNAQGKPINTQSIYLAGGCFWGVEAYMERIDGVIDAVSGYANGADNMPNPSYEQVIAGSGHAETVKVTYDADKTDLETILKYYFRVIDPTSLNKQGNDRGVQYRSGIYYTDKNDKAVIDAAVKNLQDKYEQKVVVEHEALDNFYLAETYHQDYLAKNPNGYCHIDLSLADDKIASTARPQVETAGAASQ